MLLALLCHACLDVRPADALTPYFEGKVSAEALTVDRPCPTGTELTERTKWTATCVNPARPDDELVLTFHELDGHMIGYATSIEGYAHGVHRSWYPNGVARERTGWIAGKRDGHHVVQAITGKTMVDETYVGGQLTDKVDLRVATVAPIPSVDLTRSAHVPVIDYKSKYRGLLGAVDAAWLGLAIYGHYRDRRLEAAGAVGLVASAPLVHLVATKDHKRRTSMESLAKRPAMVLGMFALYSLGKLAASSRCDTSARDRYGNCTDYAFHYNTHYNWTKLGLASAIGVIAIDGEL